VAGRPAARKSAATPSRYDAWMRRIMVGQLDHDFQGELWADLSASPEYAEWESLARRRGLEPADVNIQYHLTRGLLREVVHAAGGVEKELERVERALEAAQLWTNEAVKAIPPSADELASEYKSYSVAPSLHDASYAFVNLVTWTRAVRDRVKRKHIPSKHPIGLLPALKPEDLRDRVARALSRLDNKVGDTKRLAAYGLHAGAVPSGGTPTAEVSAAGRIKVRAPDRLTRPVVTWEEFDFNDGRDILTMSRDIMAAVETFVDEVLLAFEDMPRTTR
jgi:hypothetical protein